MSGRRVVRSLVVSVIATIAVVLGVMAAQSRTADPTSRMTPPSGAPVTRPSPTAPIPTVRVVGIGDSVMSGTSCDCDGIPAVYARDLAATAGVWASAVNLGEGGSTAESTEADLERDEIDRDVVASADVVLVIVGANDLGPADDQYEAGGCAEDCSGPLVDSMGGHLTGLLADVRHLAGPHAQVLVGTYWNVFPDGDPSIVPGGQAELEWSRSLTMEANETICRAAESASARCVDLASPFFGAGGAAPLLADDGDHPNSAGVDAIADQFVHATDVPALR